MSVDVIGVRRLRVYEEPTFGADSSASVGSYLDVRHTSAEMSTDREMLPDEHVVQRRLTENEDIPSRKSTEVSLSSYLVGTGTALDNAAAIGAITDPTFAGGQILRACMGGYRADDGSLEAGASTASIVNVTGTEGPQFPQGGAIGCHIADSVTIEAREVAIQSTDALTPSIDFSGAPIGSSNVYNAHTFYFTEDPAQSLAFLLEAPDRENIWWSFGHNGSFGIDLPLHQFPMLNYTLPGADWDQDNDVGTPFGASAFAESTYTDGDPVPFVQSEVLFTNSGAGAVTRVVLCPSEISVNLAFDVQAIPCPGGVNGMERWRHQRATPFITGEFTRYFDSATAFDDAIWALRNDRTLKRLNIQIGNLPGATQLVALPNIQITDVQPADSAGLLGFTASYKALESAAGNPTTDLERSPMRIHNL